MINTDRIVPVSTIDLISLYGTILKIAGTTLTAIEATNPAQFDVESAANALIANEPLAFLDFGSSVSTATVYFVPALDYTSGAAFTKNGSALTQSGTVVADGRTLYSASLSGSTVTVAKVGF